MARLWPLEVLEDGRAPRISDGYHVGVAGKRDHPGADIMYRRLPHEPAALPNGSRGFFCPPGARVIAWEAGEVVVAKVIGTGGQVRVRHADGTTSDYKHIERLLVALGARVEAGQPLGSAGGNVKPGAYPLRHLHFEERSAKGETIDPAPSLRKAGTQKAPPASGMVALVGLVGAKLAGVLG